MDNTVLFLAAEATPLAKVGGLADVAGELPHALRAEGVDVRLAMPFHRSIDRSHLDLVEAAAFDVVSRDGPIPATVWTTTLGGLPILLIDGPPVKSAPAVYAEPAEDAFKYTFVCLAAVGACEAMKWRPDILHAHDWQMAPAVVWLRQARAGSEFWRGTASLFTIHNLPYMGAGGEAALDSFGLAHDDERLPAWARRLPLPLALASADWLSTVSPTYAMEILTPDYGCGLEGLLEARKDELTGILNGIDTARWDPGSDPALPARFSREDLEPRRKVKAHLQHTLGLPESASVPLLGMVTRMDHQKGVDVAIQALEQLSAETQDWQFVLLGKGDPGLEDRASQFAASHPERVHFLPRFDPDLARIIYGGADLLLVPSRYEPSGLAQMIAMRYGGVPVVRATGGLRDTVIPYQPGSDGTGFVFGPPEPTAMAIVLRQALAVFEDPRSWLALQQRAMEQDFSWRSSAERYAELYEQLSSEQDQR